MINPFAKPVVIKKITENNIEYDVHTDYDLYEEVWYLSGTHRISRELGPAVTMRSGVKYWWYNYKIIKCSSQEEFAKKLNLKIFW